MRSYNIESDGQLFKMQQEAIARTREAHRKAMQAEAARRSTDNRRGEDVRIQEEKGLENEKRTSKSGTARQRQARQEPEHSRRQRQSGSRAEGACPAEGIVSERARERRESLMSSLLGGPLDDIKGALRRLSEPGRLLGDLPFLSKDSGLGKILANLRVDDLILLGLLILLIHEDADIELLIILGFLFIAGL